MTTLTSITFPEPEPRPAAIECVHTVAAEGVLEAAQDFTEPNLRIWAMYPAGAGPESIEVEVHHTDGPVTAEFVTTVIAALRRPADRRGLETSVVVSPNVNLSAGPAGNNFHLKGQQL